MLLLPVPTSLRAADQLELPQTCPRRQRSGSLPILATVPSVTERTVAQIAMLLLLMIKMWLSLT